MEDLQSIFSAIEKKVGDIVITAGIYNDLFIKDERTWRLLDNVAESVWQNIQYLLAHQIILDISKLLDPSESAPKAKDPEKRKPNLTLRRLPELVPSKKQELECLIDQANNQDFIELRNKIISHNDLEWSLGASRKNNIKNSHLLDSVANIEKVLAAVPFVYRNGYDLIQLHVQKEVQNLIDTLNRGVSIDTSSH